VLQKLKKNETKLFVLEAVEALEAATWFEIQQQIEADFGLKLTRDSIASCLKRCRHWDLVKREGRGYQLSEKGERRLQWLRKKMWTDPDIRACNQSATLF